MSSILEALGPIVAAVLVLSIPIISILVRHQQKMTLMLRDQRGGQGDLHIEQLKHDVDTLKATVNQQTIMLDQIASQQREMLASLKASDTLKERLTQ